MKSDIAINYDYSKKQIDIYCFREKSIYFDKLVLFRSKRKIVRW